jgi:hypothetical protein
MSEIYERADGKRSSYLAALSIICVVLFFVGYSFALDLCQLGFPITSFIVGIPIVGVLAAIVSLFNPNSSPPVVAGKLLLAAVNLFLLGMAAIALTGLGIANCS